jgi:hypothetical protein
LLRKYSEELLTIDLYDFFIAEFLNYWVPVSDLSFIQCKPGKKMLDANKIIEIKEI